MKKDPFTAVPIERVVFKTHHMRHLELAVPPPLARGYTTPGQYVNLKVGKEKAPFALAGTPGENLWHFLIKASSPLSKKIFSLKKRDSLETSGAIGKGFDMKLTLGRHLLLFAVGSGIAPIRAVVRWLLRDRYHYGRVTLFYGARNPDEFAYRDEFEAWKGGRIRVQQTISDKKRTDWSGAYGYVQGLISEGMLMANTAAILCGMDEMVDEVTERLKGLGMTDKYILTNLEPQIPLPPAPSPQGRGG